MAPTATLIAAVRNEGPFLVEWVAYHRVIGFDTIVIFSADSVDGTSDLLDALAAAGAILHLPNPGTGGHRNRAYARAFDLPEVAQADWVLTLDTDEFLQVHTGGGRLPDLLDRLPDADVISPSWRLFGHAGEVRFVDAPVLDRFVMAAPLDMTVSDRQFAFKSLVRPGVAAGLGPHRPRLKPDRTAADTRWVNGSGQDVTEALIAGGWKTGVEAAGYDLAQINAYPVRSAEIFALQTLHVPPLGSRPTAAPLSDLAHLNTNHEVDRRITRHAAAVAADVARLRGLPGVDSAHIACVRQTQALIATLLGLHATDSESPVTRICDPDAALALVQDQQAQVARARTPARRATDGPTTTVIDAADIAPRWLADLRRSAHRKGWYLSDDSFAVQFTRRSDRVLVVSFDNLSGVTDPSLARQTWGYDFYAAQGWSHMGVMAFEKNWYRDDALFDVMEAQQPLFARFDRVVMTGTSMGGYAATAFADLAPGCTVLAYSPQATLDPQRVPWEDRFAGGRRCDWTGRYAHAPDHCRRAEAVHILHDPYFAPDGRHAALYDGPNVQHLNLWYAAHKSAVFLRRADLLKPIMQEAVAGTLTPARYYALLRARRDLPWYHAGLSDHLLDRGHLRLAARLADYFDRTDRGGAAATIRDRLQQMPSTR